MVHELWNLIRLWSLLDKVNTRLPKANRDYPMRRGTRALTEVKPRLAQEFLSMPMELLLQYFYLQVKQLENADERMKLTNEMLSGMKVMSFAFYTYKLNLIYYCTFIFHVIAYS